MDFSNPGIAIVMAILLLVWIALMAWLATTILRFGTRRFGWGLMNWRGWLVAFGVLVGAIHIVNYLLDVLDAAMSDGAASAQLTVPSAFLTGSVAIGVGVAVVRARRG